MVHLKFLKNNGGQALVEMAIILPILLMLLFGIVELGRVLNAYLEVTQAAREGARMAAVGVSDTEVKTAVMNAAGNLVIDEADISISPSPPRERGEEVEVTVSHQVDLYSPIISNFISDPFPVEGSTVMRVE